MSDEKVDMSIEFFDDGTPPDGPIFFRLAELERQLAPSRWERVLMWFGLKKDERLSKRSWRYP